MIDFAETSEALRLTGVRVIDVEPGDASLGMLWLDTSIASAAGDIVAVRTVTEDYTATDLDYIIRVDASACPVTISLSTAVGRTGRVYKIKKIDSTSNAVTIDPFGTQTIDLGLTAVISVQFPSLEIVAAVNNWDIH